MAGAAGVVAEARALTDHRDVTLWALVPNVKGAELATAAGVDHLTVTVSASPAYSEKNIHMTIGEAFDALAAIRAAAPGSVLDAVISCCFGSPFEGEHGHPRRCRRPGRSGPGRRGRPGDPGRHHGDGDAAPSPRGARGHRLRGRTASPRHPRHGAAQRLDGAVPRRRAVRHRPRRPRRFSVRPGCRRQPGYRGPRDGARGRGNRDWHRPRRDCSTPGRCSPSSSAIACRRVASSAARRRLPSRGHHAARCCGPPGGRVADDGARRFATANGIDDFAALIRWSIDDLDDFWQASTEFTGVRWAIATAGDPRRRHDARCAVVPRGHAQLRRSGPGARSPPTRRHRRRRHQPVARPHRADVGAPHARRAALRRGAAPARRRRRRPGRRLRPEHPRRRSSPSSPPPRSGRSGRAAPRSSASAR